MNSTQQRDRCEQENEAGARCCFGPGHKCKCSFKPICLSEPQWETLIEIGRFPVRQFRVATANLVRSLACLQDRGLIVYRWIASRQYDARLTAAGRRILDDLPC